MMNFVGDTRAYSDPYTRHGADVPLQLRWNPSSMIKFYAVQRQNKHSELALLKSRRLVSLR
jgi:hypothetical protein